MSAERPVPNDFFSDRPPARIIGSETEYNVVNLTEADYEGIQDDSAYTTPRLAHNGSRLYSDGKLVEYASPECISPSELARHEYAGGLLLTKLCQEANCPAAYRRTGYDHTVKKPASAGYHENFLLPTEKFSDRHIQFMASFYASRVTWAGAGIVGRHFRLSQKAHGIGDMSGGKVLVHGEKPMFRLKEDRQTTTQPAWKRLEARSADANMSPWVTTAKFAVTSLVLRLTEHNLPKISNKWIFRHPVAILHDVSRDLSFNAKYRTKQGTTITGIEHQQAIIEAGLSLGDDIELPLEERLYGHEVYRLCDKLKQIDVPNGELGSLPDTLDWAAKLQAMLADGISVDKISRTNARAVYHDLTWERLRPNKQVIPAAFRTKAVADSYSNAKLAAYLQQPPNTRAKYRAARGNACDKYDPYGNL